MVVRFWGGEGKLSANFFSSPETMWAFIKSWSKRQSFREREQSLRIALKFRLAERRGGRSQESRDKQMAGWLASMIKDGKGTSDDDLTVGWIHYRGRRITYLLIQFGGIIFCFAWPVQTRCKRIFFYFFQMSTRLLLRRLIPPWRRTKKPSNIWPLS